MFGPLRKGVASEETPQDATQALESVGAAHLVNTIRYYLGNRDKRLVAIVGALAMSPTVIVADEPTIDLDSFHSRQIESVLRQIESVLVELKINHPISIAIAIHDMDLAARIADRVYVIAEEQLIATGSRRKYLITS
ncbi:MAG TPA: energy-coupling factor ABC transporter ATP-binding protein [Candidatus Acidoferrales bacterium]|nr:energy-coupling factor ABC transporter ATP-binding protein [Candidatus Acidoferrales bacterium]